MFESVVLPAPFSPSSACTSPAAASNVTSSFATTPGNRFEIPCIRTAGGGEAPESPAPLASPILAGVGPLPWFRRGDSGGGVPPCPAPAPTHRESAGDRPLPPPRVNPALS